MVGCRCSKPGLMKGGREGAEIKISHVSSGVFTNNALLGKMLLQGLGKGNPLNKFCILLPRKHLRQMEGGFTIRKIQIPRDKS